MIEKKQNNINNYKISFLYYHSARDAMADVIKQYFLSGYKRIYIPGYIGWSPKEGSGIFDPLNAICGLKRNYYRMTKDLYVDVEALDRALQEHSIVLLVNYFGFRDKRVHEIIRMAHSKGCLVAEDNAHGFFTYFCKGKTEADATFFSLHKMFPFYEGGGLIINNGNSERFGCLKEPGGFNPFEYDYQGIAKKRTENYLYLLELLKGREELFVPLRTISDLENHIPQTLPIVIKVGNRDRIYEIMNGQGYGVVSLYHTLIEELRNSEHEDALWLSKRILNLPIHQDCDVTEYQGMMEVLVKACEDEYI